MIARTVSAVASYIIPTFSNAETIVLLKARWLNLLESITADPTQRLTDLKASIWLGHAEARLSGEMPATDWNNTRTDYPRDAAIHEIFEEQVRRTPDAAAVIFENDAVELRSVEWARKPTRATIAKTRRRSRRARWCLDAAFAGNGHRAIGDP